MGELHPNAKKEFGLAKLPVIVLEMDLEPLLEAKVSLVKMSPISRFPLVNRDLALIVRKEIEVGDIIKCIKKNGLGLVKEAKVFDVYEGENINRDFKSVAINISLGKEGTLTDKEITNVMDKVKYELNKAFDAELRM